MKKVKKFIYLISPNKILLKNFYKTLANLFKTKKIYFFQLRLKNEKKELNSTVQLAIKVSPDLKDNQIINLYKFSKSIYIAICLDGQEAIISTQKFKIN